MRRNSVSPLGSSVEVGEQTPGTANQVLKTNAGATAAEWGKLAAANIDSTGTIGTTKVLGYDGTKWSWKQVDSTMFDGTALDANITDSSALGAGSATITLNGGSTLANAKVWRWGVKYAFDSSTSQSVTLNAGGTNYYSVMDQISSTTSTLSEDLAGDPTILTDTDLNHIFLTGIVFQRDDVTGSGTKKPGGWVWGAARRYNANKLIRWSTAWTNEDAGTTVSSIVLTATTTNFPAGTRYWCESVDLF